MKFRTNQSEKEELEWHLKKESGTKSPIIGQHNSIHFDFRTLEGQIYQGGNTSNNRKQVIQRYSTDEPQHEPPPEPQQHEQPMETSTETDPMNYNNQGQTILTSAAKKHGIETLVIDQPGRLPSIIQCAMKGDGTRVEVEQIPRLSELTNETTQAVEIASVQDPETGATRQGICSKSITISL